MRWSDASRVALQLLAHPQELLLRHTAGLLDDLRCVAREVPLEDLEDAGRSWSVSSVRNSFAIAAPPDPWDSLCADVPPAWPFSWRSDAT